MLRVQLFVVLYVTHMMYLLVHSVIWSFYYEYIYIYMYIFFLMSIFYIVCVDVCYVVDMRHLSLAWPIMITRAWPIMRNIEPFNLGSGDRLRKFGTMTHFTFVIRVASYTYPHLHLNLLNFTTYPWWALHNITLCIITWPFSIYSSLVHSLFNLTR